MSNSAYHSEYNLQRYHRKRKQFIEMLGGKCSCCGATTNLQFDHKNSKEKEFSIGVKLTYPKSIIHQELAKCQILCHSCHKQKTVLCKDGYELRAKGESVATSKLTTEQVLVIRSQEGTHDSIAKMYNVTRKTIANVKNRVTWKHLP